MNRKKRLGQNPQQTALKSKMRNLEMRNPRLAEAMKNLIEEGRIVDVGNRRFENGRWQIAWVADVWAKKMRSCNQLPPEGWAVRGGRPSDKEARGAHMSILKPKKSQQQMANLVDEPHRSAGRVSLAGVVRRLDRDVQQVSAKPQVKMVKRHEAATMLGVPTRTLQRWHKQNYGPRRSIGKRFYYLNSEIQEWIANHGRGGKRSDPSERSPKSTNSKPGDKSPAINCTKVDTPMAFIAPSDKPPAINCTKVDTQPGVSGMLVAGSSDV